MQKVICQKKNFFYYLNLPNERKKEYLQDFGVHTHFLKKWYSPVIPKEWISQEPINKIVVYFFLGEGVNGKSYKKVEKAYRKYGRLNRTIIVDRNLKLLDGFNTLLFAKNNSICVVPTIVLENVELN